MKSKQLSLICWTLFAGPTLAHEENEKEPRFSSRADDHAPIGVMGEHKHKQGEVMFSYRYMHMLMDGNRDGTSRLSTGRVLQSFPVTPTDMEMHMHMFGAMYAVSDNVTLMGMVPYLINTMDHVTGMGRRFSTRSEGIGDVRLTGIFTLFEEDGDTGLFNLGISAPTGDIEPEDDTPAGNNVELPYPMRLGSGTFDLHPALTFTRKLEDWSWGAQVGASLRFYKNREDYALGNQYNATVWGARRVTDWASASLRVAGSLWTDIRGADPELNPAMISTADPDTRGGKRIDAFVGLNLYAPEGGLKGNRLALEVGGPLYQWLDGPQLETDFLVQLGWQYSF